MRDWILKSWSTRIRERVKRTIEVLAVITSISGLTLSNLRQSNPVLFFVALGLLILLSFAVFVSWRDANTFTQKVEIDSVWQQVLKGASESVLVFAGDLSWIDRDKGVINALTQRGVDVAVLCRRPRDNELLRQNVSALINSGAKVRYYDESQTPTVKGLVVDKDSPNTGTALTVTKTAKMKFDRQYGIAGTERMYNYHGTRYVPPEDIEHVRVLSQLFGALWDKGLTGFLLKPISLTHQELAKLVSVVPQYSYLSALDVDIAVADIRSLWASCGTVKAYKEKNTLALLDAFETQKVKPFTTCVCLTHNQPFILLPPILEKHGDKLVVIDGMHRLYFRLVMQEQADAECLVISHRPDLPSDPVPFSEVRLVQRKLPRQESFQGFKPPFFRNIDLLDGFLATSCRQLIASKTAPITQST